MEACALGPIVRSRGAHPAVTQDRPRVAPHLSSSLSYGQILLRKSQQLKDTHCFDKQKATVDHSLSLDNNSGEILICMPQELLELVLLYLEVHDVVSLGATCLSLYQRIRSQALWTSLRNRDFCWKVSLQYTESPAVHGLQASLPSLAQYRSLIETQPCHLRKLLRCPSCMNLMCTSHIDGHRNPGTGETCEGFEYVRNPFEPRDFR